MAYNNTALRSYQKAQVYDEIDPKKLILMLYEGAIKRIKLSQKGIRDNNPQLRGENLGKAIAIISELNACLDTRDQSEEILFLRGLYAAMLVELPKVSITNDLKTLERAERYLLELKKIWETTVMPKVKSPSSDPAQVKGKRAPNSMAPIPNGYPGRPQKTTSFAV